MKSLGILSDKRFKIAAAAVFAVLLVSGPAMALESYEFGEVAVGSESTVPLAINNLSPSSELTFSLSLQNGGQAGFSLQSTQVTIPAGGSAEVQVTFAPSAVGSCTDTLQVYYKTFLIDQVSIALSGTGIEQAASTPQEKWAAAIAYWQYNGKTISDNVQECFESAENRGEAVSCVANLAAKLRKERIISHADAREMRSFALKKAKHHKYDLKQALKHQHALKHKYSQKKGDRDD